MTFFDMMRVKTTKNGQKLTNLKTLYKNIRKTVMAKSKARVFIKFDSFGKIQDDQNVKKCQNHEKSSKSVKTAFLDGPLGLKISKQSQNSQKIRKSQSETDQKWSKNGQKVVKSPFGNDILGVKKVWFWIPPKRQNDIFRVVLGSENPKQS